MPHPAHLTRRQYLTSTAATCASASWIPSLTPAADKAPKRVAAVLTAYEHGLHADVLLGKILEGWNQDGGPGPALTLASMYVDQFTDKDLARSMGKKYNVPIFDTIEGAVTVGTKTIPVDGVISIGEHGTYPSNHKGQVLHPRRRFFEGITDTFAKYQKVVPVFNDKHLGPVWSDAKWMYDRAVDMQIPFMAGSSMPVGYREPDRSLPLGCEIETAVAVGYSGLDIYGIHTLEFLQCHLERRRNAERGVRWVQCLQGEAMWKVLDDGLISQAAFDAALAHVPHEAGDVRSFPDTALFFFEYTDGLRAAVFMLTGFAGGTSVALQQKGQRELFVTRFDERTEPRYPHFAWLLKGIERMVHTGEATYPVERTLLTSGILDRALTSRVQQHRRLKTPELAIAYQSTNYPHAPHPPLDSSPNP